MVLTLNGTVLTLIRMLAEDHFLYFCTVFVKINGGLWVYSERVNQPLASAIGSGKSAIEW
jgi:hypothetical protein